MWECLQLKEEISDEIQNILREVKFIYIIVNVVMKYGKY